MAASISGTLTVTADKAPHLTAAVLTAILAKAPEDITLAEFATLQDALARTSEGTVPSKTIGEALT